MLSRVRTDPRLHPVIQNAIARLDQTDTPIEIRTLAAAAGWSDRYFIRTFRAQVGITPKTFDRLHRFQAALRRIRHESEIDWAQIALACGYYDQAHFIRDFKAFSGMTPGTFRRLPMEVSNRLPLPRRNSLPSVSKLTSCP